MKQDGHGFLTQPWPLTRPHLEDNAAHTPDIDLGVVALALRVDDLGSHPENSSLHRGIRGRHVDVVGALRDTKVGDLADTGGLNKDVVRFQILE